MFICANVKLWITKLFIINEYYVNIEYVNKTKITTQLMTATFTVIQVCKSVDFHYL